MNGKIKPVAEVSTASHRKLRVQMAGRSGRNSFAVALMPSGMAVRLIAVWIMVMALS